MIKNILLLLLLFSTSFVRNVMASETIVVVANTPNKSIQLNRQQVRNLFMGGVTPYNLKAIALPPENQIRVLFNTKVVGLTESRIQSYWAQMRFTGRRTAPKEIKSEALALQYLTKNEGSVAYLSSTAHIPSELTILFKVN